MSLERLKELKGAYMEKKFKHYAIFQDCQTLIDLIEDRIRELES